jgi:ABC-type transport system involved in Fe-S cluster assembly fused permease/ATPase subunit
LRKKIRKGNWNYFDKSQKKLRVYIARVFLKNAPIVVLDEITANALCAILPGLKKYSEKK